MNACQHSFLQENGKVERKKMNICCSPLLVLWLMWFQYDTLGDFLGTCYRTIMRVKAHYFD